MINQDLQNEFEKYNERIFENEPNLKEWFLKVLPIALLVLRNEPTSLPNDFLFEELTKHKEINEMEFLYSKRIKNIKLRKKIIRNAQNRWNKLLDDIIYHCKESSRETSSFKWKYKAEFIKALNEFNQKYGYQGEKIEGNYGKNVIPFGEGEELIYEGPLKKYNMKDMDEYKEITLLFNKECNKAAKHRDRHQKKALELFTKYFNYLCCESVLRLEELKSEQKYKRKKVKNNLS